MPEQHTLVLVHGAWHGSWCWQELLPLLDGVNVRLVDLPSVGEREGPASGLYADADVLRAAVRDVAGPVVVCAHSYGGAVASQALADLDNVEHIVYLCAFLLGKGESLLRAVGGSAPPWWDVRDGYVEATEPRRVFYDDCSRELADSAIAKLRPQRMAAFTEELTSAAWESVPSTYVVCTRDQAIPPQAQRQLAGRAGAAVELESSHSPMLSRPAELAELLRAIR